MLGTDPSVVINDCLKNIEGRILILAGTRIMLTQVVLTLSETAKYYAHDARARVGFYAYKLECKIIMFKYPIIKWSNCSR